MRGRSVWTLNHQNLSIERQRVRGANRLTGKPQPPRAKARWGRCVMRSACIVAACVGLALLVGGCDPTRDSRYLREGIGTDLYWDGLPAATQLQDIYLANICAQAVSPTARSVDTVSCDGLSLGRRDWGLLVQAGMNDIDLRCDAYLAWLYDRKSSKEPFLKELASLGGAAAGILRATDAGATPIALTAIAFGIAADTFTNIDLRLVNAVDYTTVNSVVRDNRTQFRINNIDLVIDNRPAAIYVLRSYLSICVPDSIEMSINNTVTVYHRGGPDALRTQPIGLRTAPATSATSAAVRGAPVVIRADRPPPVTAPVKISLLSPITDIERKSVSLDDAKAFQRTLCVSDNGDFGPHGSPTRTALRTFFQALYYPRDAAAPDTIGTDADLDRLRAAQSLFPSCKATGFANSFEVGLFARPVNSSGMVDPMKNVSSIASALNGTVPEGLRSPSFGPAVIDAIHQIVPQLRTKFSLPGPAAIDRPLYDKITRAGAPQ
jgi:hypothetical protein